MEHWYYTEIHARRDDILKSARRRRLARLATSGRSSTVRARVAEIAETISERLAQFADDLRGTENA